MQAEGGDVPGALRTAAHIGDPSDKFRAWQDIARAQAKAGDAAGALQTASTIEDPSDKARAWREIAKVQAKVGDTQGALSWGAAESQDFLKANALLGVAEGILERVQLGIGAPGQRVHSPCTP
jgi:hypothetical protein